MGFFATIGRGWQMSKLSMSVVKKDPELMVYMIISGVLSMAAFVAIIIAIQICDVICVAFLARIAQLADHWIS